MSHTWRFDAIGVPWEIVTPAELSGGVQAAVLELIDRFDTDWSRFRSDSQVAKLASAGGVAKLVDAEAMLSLYAALSDATGGAIQPLVGDALAALGYDADYSLRPSAPRPAPNNWHEVLSWVGDEVTLRGGTIDIGALGKGRIVDLVLDLLPDGPGLVDASGDLAMRGQTPVRIGLEHPLHPDRVVGVASIANGAVAASATNRRAWGDGLHHVIDARTGVPVRTVMATWVVAPTAMIADAVASALFFDGGIDFAAEYAGVEWALMRSTGVVEHSELEQIELFLG